MASNDSNQPRPRIGITAYRQVAAWGDWETGAVLLPEAYVDAVIQADGIPLLLSPGITGDPADYLTGLDGLIIAGGADIDPLTYGAPPHPETLGDPVRDALDLRLCSAALASGLPLLGICRGAQVLNVVRGGTLHQHIPDLVSAGAGTQPVAPHAHRGGPAVSLPVWVDTEPGTRARALLGEHVRVPCYHHQSIATLGAGLSVTARADDGTVEAIEDPDAPFVFAVQFHPEADQLIPELRAPFSALVSAAREASLAAAPSPFSPSEGLHHDAVHAAHHRPPQPRNGRGDLPNTAL